VKRLAALAVLLVLLAPQARAAGPEVLTDTLKDHLASLKPLKGDDVRTLFDGRPVLVKFFASW
jgi:hypothetical protein